MSCSKDRQILNSVLNPLLPIGEGVYDDQETIPDNLIDPSNSEDNQNEETKELEVESIKKCNSGNYDEALNLMSEAIRISPNKASCYNNRAQIYRLKLDTTNAMKDLNKAIQISGGSGRTACQAFTQRAMIRWKENEMDLAVEDFKRAASLGSPFAKSALIQLNPYSAMCNKMLKNVFEALETGSEVVKNPFDKSDIKSG